MSKGPGRVERAMRELFAREPDMAFALVELAAHCYPDARPVEKKHLVAAGRAVANVIARDPDWTSFRACRPGRPKFFYNQASAHSHHLAGLMDGSWEVSVWDRRLQRSRPRTEQELAALKAALVAMLAPGGKEHARLAETPYPVELHVAKRDGDAVRVAALEAENAAEMRARADRLAALLGGRASLR